MTDVPSIPRKHDPRWVAIQHATTAVRLQRHLGLEDDVAIEWLVEKLPWGTTTVENLVLGMEEVGMLNTDAAPGARPTVIRYG